MMSARARSHRPILLALLLLGGPAHAGYPQQDSPAEAGMPAPPPADPAGTGYPDGPPAAGMPALPPAVAPPPPPPMWLPAVRPAAPPPTVPSLSTDEQLERANQRRSTGIALVVVGNILQFAGVSLLVPAVWHSLSHDTFPVAPFAAAGASLAGVGNIVEGFGWAFTVKGGRERDRLRGHRPPDDR